MSVVTVGLLQGCARGVVNFKMIANAVSLSESPMFLSMGSNQPIRPITTPQKTQDLRFLSLSALFKLCDCLSQTEYCGKNISETLTYFRTRYQMYLLIDN